MYVYPLKTLLVFYYVKKKYVCILLNNIFILYVKLHVFRLTDNLIGGQGCDVSMICLPGWPVLWRGWAYRGE